MPGDRFDDNPRLLTMITITTSLHVLSTFYFVSKALVSGTICTRGSGLPAGNLGGGERNPCFRIIENPGIVGGNERDFVDSILVKGPWILVSLKF